MPVGGSAGVAVGVARNQASNKGIDSSLSRQQSKWSAGRRLTHDVVEGHFARAIIIVCIIANTALVVYETDRGAVCDGQQLACEEDTEFTRAANIFLLAIYSVEMFLKLYAHRLSYFKQFPDLFDMFIVSVGFADLLLGGVLPGIGILRLFRVARVVRAVKITNSCDEVKVFISGIASAGKAIIIGSALIFFSLFLFAIAAVMLLNPVNQEVVRSGRYDVDDCERCKTAYSSVTQALLTLVQIVVMQDAWGDFTIPLIEQQSWTVFFFIITSFTIGLGLTNLVLAVIVDKALENREYNLQKEAAKHAQELEDAQRMFVDLCAEIDLDGNGFITLDELLSAYDHDVFNPLLKLMDIGQNDMKHVFNVMDADKTGFVSYELFAVQLQSLKSQDLHTMCAFMKHYVFESHEKLRELSAVLIPSTSTDPPRQQAAAEGNAAPLTSPPASPNVEVAGLDGDRFDRGPCGISSAVAVRGVAAADAGTTALRAHAEDLERSFEAQIRLLQEAVARDIDLRASVVRALLLHGEELVAVARCGPKPTSGQAAEATGRAAAATRTAEPQQMLSVEALKEGQRHAVDMQEPTAQAPRWGGHRQDSKRAPCSDGHARIRL